MTTRPPKSRDTLRRLEKARLAAKERWAAAHIELYQAVRAWVAACEAHAKAKAKAGR